MTGTNTYSAADLAAVIPEIWLPKVLEAYFAKTVAANFFTDMSSDASRGGDIFHIAEIFTNVLTSAAKSAASEVTLVSPAMTDIQLTVNTWRHIAYLIEDMELQHNPDAYNILKELSQQAGDVLADDLEDNILALWSGLSQSGGSTGSAVTDLQIRTAIRTLDSNNIPKRDRGWFIHPRVFWDQVAAVQKYYDASMRGLTGAGMGPTVTGNFGDFNVDRGLYGHLYGDPVFVTTNVVTNLTAYRNIYAHRKAFAFAVITPGGSRVRLQSKYVLENLGILTVADTIYGSVELRDAAGYVLNGSTTATTA